MYIVNICKYTLVIIPCKIINIYIICTSSYDNKQNISPIFPLYTLYIWCHNMKHRHCYWPINIKLSNQAGARETIINRSINYYQCLDQHSLVCSALRDSSNSTDPVAWDRAYLILLSAPDTPPPNNNNPPAQPSVVVGPLSLSWCWWWCASDDADTSDECTTDNTHICTCKKGVYTLIDSCMYVSVYLCL